MPSGDVVKIRLPILVMCLVILFTQLLMSKTRLGRQIYAFGGNPEAASRIGIDILGVQLFAYGYLGLLAAVGGFIQAYRVHQAVPTAMAGQELNVLAVAILGGASLVGGIGTMGGVVLGVLFLAILQRRTEPAWRFVVLLRSCHWAGDIGLDNNDGLCREASAATSHLASDVMQHPVTRYEQRPVVSDADRLIGWMRRGTVGLGGQLSLLAILLAFFSLVEPTTFPRGTTVQALMCQSPELGLLALAMAIPPISGGINLAIIATANLSGLLMAWVLTAAMLPDAAGGQLVWLADRCPGFGLCFVCDRGNPTGLLVAAIGVHPILVTLGTMTLLHGIGIYFTRGRTLSGFPEPLIAIANKTVLGVPISFARFTLVAVAVHVLMTRTALGICIRHDWVQPRGDALLRRRYRTRACMGLLLSSLLCWLAAVVMMARFNAAGADIAQFYLLITILAAILGGIDPYGGFGRISGLFLALIVLQVIASGFNILGLSPHLALASWGGILLLAVALKLMNFSFLKGSGRKNGQ